MVKFTIKQFNEAYPDDNACLDEIFNARYGHLKTCPSCNKETTFYKIKNRKVYSCKLCGHQLSPTANTIFHKSSTPLKDWFFAIYLFSTSKNGVSAKELERQLGCTYKTAWRIGQQIRKLFSQNSDKLKGIVEVDETFYGGKSTSKRFKTVVPETKKTILGIVEREGDVKAMHVRSRGARILHDEIIKNVDDTATVMTDEYPGYKNIYKYGFNHEVIAHYETFVKGNTHTNTIEGFWGQLKRSINGTYHVVSGDYLQRYIDEFSYRYNHRKSPVPLFHLILSEAVRPVL